MAAIYILYIGKLAEKRLKLGCHKNVQQLVTCNLQPVTTTCKLVFEAFDEDVRSRSFAAYLSSYQWGYGVNLCAKFSNFLFSSDESSLS